MAGDVRPRVYDASKKGAGLARAFAGLQLLLDESKNCGLAKGFRLELNDFEEVRREISCLGTVLLPY